VSDFVALTRDVSPAIANAELTNLPRVPIDATLAARQHAEYERVLTELGCSVVRLPAGPDMADSVFVDDTAVVLEEIALIAHLGAPSRRPETEGVEEWLKHHRLLGHIEAPGTLDGGDVLPVGRSVFVGRTSRTNEVGIEQASRVLEYFGYTLHPVTVRGCLHLKSAVTAVADDVLVINRACVPADAFSGFDLIDVDPSEPGAANVARVGDRLICAAAFPRTRERLERRGLTVSSVDLSEIAKAEGAVTCCSLIFRPSD
jgi:dimethylargininase